MTSADRQVFTPDLEPLQTVLDPLAVARVRLSTFVLEQAEKTAAEVGFRWIGEADAPNTYNRLTAAYQRSATNGLLLPISNENSGSTIYTDSSVNLAMRFWHDVHHVRLGLTFHLVDELELGLWHLDQCRAADFPEESLVWRLLHADLIGQATVMAYGRRFPLDQERFASSCLTSGIDHAVLDELRRSP